MIEIKKKLDAIIKNYDNKPDVWKNVVAIVNSKPDEAKIFCSEIKAIIKESPADQRLVALDLIDYVVDQCNLPLHNQVSSKDFITFLLTLLKVKDAPEVQFKILGLIKKWGIKFENKKDVLPNFYETYNSLLKSGVIFPDKTESTYFKYIENESLKKNEPVDYPDFSNFNISAGSSISANKNSSNSKVQSNVNNTSSSNASNPKNNYGNVSLDLNPEKYPKKYKKFVGELETLLNYIALANEMIDNVDYKQKLDEGVREMVSTVRDLDKNLQLAIENQIFHEDLMAICLGINDDINKLFRRYDDLKGHRKPEPFLSSFHTDYIQYNLNYKEEAKEVNPSNSSISSNQNKGNANLIDFDFSGSGNTGNVIPQSNLSNNQSQNQNNKNSNASQKINDINDIFDAFK